MKKKQEKKQEVPAKTKEELEKEKRGKEITKAGRRFVRTGEVEPGTPEQMQAEEDFINEGFANGGPG